jgi:hypothetical protein
VTHPAGHGRWEPLNLGTRRSPVVQSRETDVQLVAETTQWFGADGLRPVPEPELPAVLSHGPTRRFLAEVGLPPP